MKMFVWETKVNFVDENNVFLGYSLEQDCCEYADWFISDKLTDKFEGGRRDQIDHSIPLPDLTDFRFDTGFFHDAGCCHIVFRIVNDAGAEKFIHLFNVHEGYYGHGFEFGIVDGSIIRTGTI
jgi:hypothetical protein